MQRKKYNKNGNKKEEKKKREMNLREYMFIKLER